MEIWQDLATLKRQSATCAKTKQQRVRLWNKIYWNFRNRFIYYFNCTKFAMLTTSSTKDVMFSSERGRMRSCDVGLHEKRRTRRRRRHRRTRRRGRRHRRTDTVLMKQKLLQLQVKIVRVIVIHCNLIVTTANYVLPLWCVALVGPNWFGLDVPSYYPSAKPILPNSHPPTQNLAATANPKSKSTQPMSQANRSSFTHQISSSCRMLVTWLWWIGGGGGWWKWVPRKSKATSGDGWTTARCTFMTSQHV